MKRLSAWLFIGTYLSALSFGVVSHALKIGESSHPVMYFIVWDMFCGWNAYDSRYHVFGETESGEFVEVHQPWGAFQPFGELDRQQYDIGNRLLSTHIRHVLDHTQHEPMARVYVVEEVWPKQYNLPDPLWDQYYAVEKDRVSYFNLLSVCNEDGYVVESFPAWYAVQDLNSVASNPRLKAMMQQATPFYNTNFNPRNSNGGLNASTATFDTLNTN